MKFGVQLYNFRNELKPDFRGALKKIAELGFDGVEFACNYGGITPDMLAVYLKELGIECAGTMFGVNDLLDPGNIAYEYAKQLNSPAITISAMCDFTKEWENIAEKCRKIGINAAGHGLIFSYHNHWAEFEKINGVPAMYRILDSTDPATVFVEPDVCWLTRAGINPSDFIEKYADRIRQIHLKDICVPDNPETTVELGQGIVDLQSVCVAASKTNCQWLIYEQDYTKDPFRSAKLSLEYLRMNVKP
ncbi:MAG: Inosose dehydratase [Lentisphaerae bacterium ADurb.Bin242]|nr:MAG: Inosose dehydratase [Lentisphaerae bacterium ADurb.Bin242]